MRNNFFEIKMVDLVKEHLTDEITNCRIRNLSIVDIANVLREKYGVRVDIERGMNNYTTTLTITLDIFYRSLRFGFAVIGTEFDRLGPAIPLNEFSYKCDKVVEEVKLPEELFRID
jgi:hypothetical protein